MCVFVCMCVCVLCFVACSCVMVNESWEAQRQENLGGVAILTCKSCDTFWRKVTDKSNHLSAGSLRSVPQESWSLTASSGKANEQRNPEHVVLDLFSNFKKWVGSKGFFWWTSGASDNLVWANFGKQKWRCPPCLPCVHSKRPRVYWHHAHMCFIMCVVLAYTETFWMDSRGFSAGHTTTPHTTSHGDRDRDRQRKKTEQEREKKDERQKTRQEKTRRKRREDR